MQLLLSILSLVVNAHGFTMMSTWDDGTEVSRTITMDLDSRLTCVFEPLVKEMVLNLDLNPDRDPTYMSMRLTSPSGQFSDWAEGEEDVFMQHKATESGDYEICLATRRPVRVVLSISFHDPDKLEKSMEAYFKVHEIKENLKTSVTSIVGRVFSIYNSIKSYNKISVRDEAMQQSNSDYIRNYVFIFCLTNIVVAVAQMEILLLLLCLVFYSDAISMYTLAGTASYVGRTITIDLESRFTCFYEPLEEGMQLKLTLSKEVQSTPMSESTMAVRLTSPSQEFSEWAEAKGTAYMDHSVTENGDYEICLSATTGMRVVLTIFFHHPKKLQESLTQYNKANELSGNMREALLSLARGTFHVYDTIKFSNMISFRDEAMQRSNSYYIKTYVITFCITNVIVAVIQVIIVRWMFREDKSKIRI